MNDTSDQTIPKIATVTVTDPVDGTPKVKRRGKGKKVQSTELHTDIKVDQRVWSKARSILAEGRYDRIEIIDHETVIVR